MPSALSLNSDSKRAKRGRCAGSRTVVIGRGRRGGAPTRYFAQEMPNKPPLEVLPEELASARRPRALSEVAGGVRGPYPLWWDMLELILEGRRGGRLRKGIVVVVTRGW